MTALTTLDPIAQERSENEHSTSFGKRDLTTEVHMKEKAIDESKVQQSFLTLARAFLDGANFARCDVRDGVAATRVVFGRERLDDGRPSFSISVADANAMWHYAYNLLSIDGMSSHAVFDPSLRQSTVLRRMVDGSQVALTFESIPYFNGTTVLLGNRSTPSVFFEQLVREVEAEIVAQHAVEAGDRPEIDMMEVVAERFAAGHGVLSLQPGMTDAMIATLIKAAASHGKPFVVIPPK